MVCVAIACVCLPAMLSSCSSDDDDTPAEETYDAYGFDAPKYEKESALYKVTSSESSIASIEFTCTGEYIIINKQTDDEVMSTPLFASKRSALHRYSLHTPVTRSSSNNGMQCGHYTTKGDGVYKLDGFGTIVVTGGESNAIKLTITLLNGWKIDIGAQKGSQYAETAKTNALCRKWDFEKVVVHKATGDVTYSSITEWDRQESKNWSEDEAATEPVQILFTKSGSYIVFYADQELDVATWAWTDETTGAARYSWDWNDLYASESGPLYFSFEGKQLLCTALEEYYDGSYSDYYSVTYYCTESK